MDHRVACAFPCRSREDVVTRDDPAELHNGVHYGEEEKKREGKLKHRRAALGMFSVHGRNPHWTRILAILATTTAWGTPGYGTSGLNV